MADPVLWTDSICPTAILIVGPPQVLNAHTHLAVHVLGLAEANGQCAQHVCPLARHPFLNRIVLLADAGPTIVDVVYHHMDVAQAIVMVGGIFVVYATLESESRRGHVGDYPRCIPHRVRLLPDGCRSPLQRGILLVARRQRCLQFGNDIRIGRESVDVGEREVGRAVEGDLDSVAGRRFGDRRIIEAAGGTLLTRVCARLLLQRRRRVLLVALLCRLGRTAVGRLILVSVLLRLCHRSYRRSWTSGSFHCCG